MAIQIKAVEQYFPVVLFIMLYKVVLTFESADEILKCGNSDQSCGAVPSCGAVCCAVCCTRWFYLLSPSEDELLKRENSDESY